MITVGSVTRDTASGIFPFLAEKYPGRRKAIKEFTHLAPDFVFWVYPDGTLFDAKDAHRKNYPKGYEHILDDSPEYGGFLRGRVASNLGPQIVVVYCQSDALAVPGPRLAQLLMGIDQMPIPIARDTLVVSDNADIYGTLSDLRNREHEV